MIKSKFTLIELIVVIVVLGLLAAIVIPNINSYSKEAKVKAMYADARNIETAVDKFALEHNGSVPTLDTTPALKGVPEWINLEQLDSNYLKTKPKSTQNFYLEESGHVFPLLGKLPTEYKKDPVAGGDTTFVIVFEHADDIKQIKEIQVVQVENDKVKEIVETIQNKDLVVTEKGGKFEVEIIVKTPTGVDGNDLALVIVDNAKNESPIINGGVPIGGGNNNGSSGGSNGGEDGGNNGSGEVGDLGESNIDFTIVKNSDGTVTIKAVATDPDGVSHILLPNGQKVDGDTASFNVSENKDYTFTVVDSKNNSTDKTYTVKDILLPSDIKEIMTVQNGAIALLGNGDVYAIGKSTDGELGLGTPNATASQWTKINGSYKVKEILEAGIGIALISENNDVYVSGASEGTGLATTVSTPTKITFPSKIKKAYSSGYSINYILENGDHYVTGLTTFEGGTGCGSCLYNKAIKSTTPVGVDSMIGYAPLYLSLYKGTNGKYYAAGYPSNVFVDTPNKVYSEFTEVNNPQEFNLSDIKDMQGYRWYAVFLLNNGDVYLGTSSRYEEEGDLMPVTSKPTLISKGIEKIVVDGMNTFLITKQGDVYAFGKNEFGELGLGHKNKVKSPTKLPISKVKDISIYYGVASFLLENGDLYATGKNVWEGTASSSNSEFLTPIKVNRNILK